MLPVLSIIKKIKEKDIKVLLAIERGMRNHEYVPFDVLLSYTKFTRENLKYFLKRLVEFGLVKEKQGYFPSYNLRNNGYDCLASDALVRANIIKAFGKKLGVGKEADVYDVLLAENDERAVVKIHRVGRASFIRVKRYRTYIGNRRHISWLYLSRLAAEREFEALKILYEGNLPVPKPIFHNRHIIVMSFIDGKLLAEIDYIKNPEKILNEILDFIYISFKEYDIIHSDLSEFNIMITEDLELLIFDFPQWISSEHPQYIYYLKRDIANILDFFRKKFGIILDRQEIYSKFEL